MPDSVSSRLRAAIDEAGYSLREAARICDIPYRTLQDYVAGKREPGAGNLAKISTQLRISGDWLLTGEGPRERGMLEAPSGESHVRRLIEEAVTTAEDLAKAEGVSLTKEERAELVVAVYDELVKIEQRKSKELKSGKVIDFFQRKKAS